MLDDVSDEPVPRLIGARYCPVRRIGSGGMGVVYEVEHLHTGQRMALKVLRRQAHRLGATVERFQREVRAASRVSSDHVVRVTDAGVAPELDDAPFFVMELLEGADLERAAGSTPVPPERVVGWLRQVALGLTKAHDAGIVHRDLKPENLFLTTRDDGTPLVKILDFGVAKVAAEGQPLTTTDSFLGTPGYMAPEQTDSRGPPVTFRSDLYALGLIAFRLLTGRRYWREGSLAQLLAQILAEPMPPASERGAACGPAFDAWFERACAREPEQRFDSAVAQIEALAAALGVADRPAPPPPPRRSRGARAATLAAVALGLLLARLLAFHDERSEAAQGVNATARAAPAALAAQVAAEMGSPNAIPEAAETGPAVPVASAPDAAAPSRGATSSASTARRPAPPGSAARPAPSAAERRDPLEGPW